MKYSENVINVLTAISYNRIGNSWIINNIFGNETINTIVNKLSNSLKYTIEIDDFVKVRNFVIDKLELLAGYADGAVAVGDTNFPICRGNVMASEKPVALFYKGNLKLLEKNNKNIAVIGLRNPDDDIIEIEEKVVANLAKKATIVSGLALGCDTIAHKQALKMQSNTIAILPNSLNIIYPASNKELAAEIVLNDGLLISEYLEQPNSDRELISRLIYRDRLQALYSDVVVLAASYAKNSLRNDSGARHAMGKALDYSIARAVIYNPKLDQTNPKYDLNRQLLKDPNVQIINSENLDLAIKNIFDNISSNQNQQLNKLDKNSSNQHKKYIQGSFEL